MTIIFDSYFDSYRGVILLVKVVDGTISIGDKIKMLATNATFEVVELGVHTPGVLKYQTLKSGEVGFIAAAIKDISQVSVGDTVTTLKNPATKITRIITIIIIGFNFAFISFDIISPHRVKYMLTCRIK